MKHTIFQMTKPGTIEPAADKQWVKMTLTDWAGQSMIFYLAPDDAQKFAGDTARMAKIAKGQAKWYE